MPRLEPKIIQKELDQGLIWPVYWLYGHERMKSRELLKRIRKTVVDDGDRLGFAEEILDGNETSSDSVLEAAQSLSLGFGGEGSIRFVVVREAHALKNPDAMIELLRPRAKKSDLTSVVVFLSKDLDGRKKFSKMLLEKAAVVPCEEVPETEREAWVQYLAKRRGMTVPVAMAAQLVLLDPWNLDIIDQELEKLSLATGAGDGSGDGSDVLLSGTALLGGVADHFLHAFFTRDLKSSIEIAEIFADQPDQSLPLLGLLSWNVRQLAVLLADRAAARSAKSNPYAAEKLARWAPLWTLPEVLELQQELARLDFNFKQTPLLPLGLWTELVARFTRSSA